MKLGSPDLDRTIKRTASYVQDWAPVVLKGKILELVSHDINQYASRPVKIAAKAV